MAKEEIVLKVRSIPHFKLVIDGEDGSPEKVWRLAYSYRELAKIEETTGLELKKYDDWEKVVSSKYFPKVIHGGLEKFNPEVTYEEVLDVLNPEAQRKLSDAILELCFPGVTESYQKLLADEKTGATADPNVLEATPASA
jgi:hypothetical protein